MAWGEVRDAAPLAMLHPDIVPPVVGTFAVCVEDNTTVDPSTCECRSGHWRQSTWTCAPCAPGTFKNTLGDAATCAACPRGFFQPEAGQDVCTPCPAGTYDPNPDPAANRSTEEAVCQPCPANATSTMVAAHACVCVPGYTDYASAGVCLLCADNTFQPYYRSGAACTPCPERTSGTPRDVRHACVQCEQDQHWDGALDQCMCNAGYVWREAPQNDNGGAFHIECVACRPGFFRNSSMPHAIDACTACPAGQYTTSAGSTACTSCPYGTWAMDPRAASCAPCDIPGTIFDTTTARCSTTCGVGQYARDSTSCETCPTAFTYAPSGSTACTACGANKVRPAADTGTEPCTCKDAAWRNVTWDNHPLGYPTTSCVPPDTHCADGAGHERIVALRLHTDATHEATGAHGCPRAAFDIDFVPDGIDPVTHRARYRGSHKESREEAWSLAWNVSRATYTIETGDGDVVAYFSAPAYNTHVRWEDTPSNMLDHGVFWNCSGETVDVRPVVECAACSPGQYFARQMIMSPRPDSTQSTDCLSHAAYFEGPYEFHGTWVKSKSPLGAGSLSSVVYQHNMHPLALILSAYRDDGSVSPVLQIRSDDRYIDFAVESAHPTNGTYDAPGSSVSVRLGPDEFAAVYAGYGPCTVPLDFEITFGSGCVSCGTATNTTEHRGWRFGGEVSREIFWEQTTDSMGRAVYVATPSIQESWTLAYLLIADLGYATYAIVNSTNECWTAQTPAACTRADLVAFYNMSLVGSRRVNITRVYGDSNGLGHWHGRAPPVMLARCTEYECPRGTYAMDGTAPQYRLDCAFCPPGTYDEDASSGCTDCPVGTYGTHVAQVDDSQCQSCSVGFEDMCTIFIITGCPLFDSVFTTYRHQIANSCYNDGNTSDPVLYHIETERDDHGQLTWKANREGGHTNFLMQDISTSRWLVTINDVPEAGWGGAKSLLPLTSICSGQQPPCPNWDDIEEITRWHRVDYDSNLEEIYVVDTTIRAVCTQKNCTACPPGSSKSGNGTGAICRLCSAGTYADSAAASKCTDCAAGYEALGDGSVFCTACNADEAYCFSQYFKSTFEYPGDWMGCVKDCYERNGRWEGHPNPSKLF